MDVIKILGLVKSFALMMWCIYGAFYQKWIDLSTKGLCHPCRVSKKNKMALFWPQIGIDGCNQNIGARVKFCLCDVVHLRCFFFQKCIDPSSKGLFYQYRVSKKYKMALFWPKIGIYGCDQNIGSREKFCLYDVVHLWCLLSKMDRYIK